MTYHNAIKYINSAPNVSPKDDSASERIQMLCEHIGNPQKRVKYIRLAGNNGKTVCARMITSILNSANISSACLSMPLCPELRDNILINGEPITMEETVEYVEIIKNAVDTINENNADDQDSRVFRPTAHEILLCMALLAFSAHKSSVCMIESDHEGEDPSRFLPAPFAAIICGTIPDPASNRQDVSRIRSYVCRGVREIVSAHQSLDALRFLQDACASVNCRLTLASKSKIELKRLALRGTEFDYDKKNYTLRVCGYFQIANATVAIESCEMLARMGYSIDADAIAKGLKNASAPCKFEILSVSPTIIADSTHTPVAIEAVCDSLSDFKDVTGTRIRLCLPDGELINLYSDALERRGYTVSSVVALVEKGADPSDCASLSAPVYLFKTAKQTALHATEQLDKDEFLLISGPSNFTRSVRYELLSHLAFGF